jgi:hypothetical protein
MKALPAAAAAYMRYTINGTPNASVGRIYFKIETESAAETIILDTGLTTGGTTTNPRIYIDVTNNKIILKVGGTTIATSGNTYTVGAWSYIDWSFDTSANPWQLKAKLDGGTEFSGTSSTAADTFINLRVGGTAGASTLVIYYDDLVLSSTLADYPIGAGGTELLVPGSDGTHNAGTNTMEDNAGTDIGTTTAYDKINSVPMGSATTYIRQATIGTGNYAEINFADITATHSAIIGAMGILSYTAATTTTDKGGCIISKDSFSSFTEIWGNPTTRQDYSDGSTSNVYWKSAIISGAVDDTTVNALKGRVGYSDDVTPNPYWIDLAVEVAYSTASAATKAPPPFQNRTRVMQRR